MEFSYFLPFYDYLAPPGGQIHEPIFLKGCILIDLMSHYKFAIHCVSELWIARMLGGIFWYFCLFPTIWRHLAAKCRPIFLKLCTLVDIMIRYKCAIHCVSELWIVRMLGGIFLFFAFLRLFDATWRPNTRTNIPERLHPDRSHVTLQICNSLCNWIMNSKDARWNFQIFFSRLFDATRFFFPTIWCHLVVAKCRNQYSWKFACW